VLLRIKKLPVFPEFKRRIPCFHRLRFVR